MRYLGRSQKSGIKKYGQSQKLENGDYIVVCDISGFPTPASQTRYQWDGTRVRSEFWTRRQPQDFVEGVIDEMAVRDPRPIQETITFVDAQDENGGLFEFSDGFIMNFTA